MVHRSITFRSDCKKYPLNSEVVKDASMDIELEKIGENQSLHLKVSITLHDDDRAIVHIHMGNELIKGWWVCLNREKGEITLKDIL